jgi:hypothetical protein
MITNTGINPINRTPSYSRYGLYSGETTPLPASLATEIMNAIFDIDDKFIDTFSGRFYPLREKDFFLLEEVIQNNSKPNDKIIELFKQFE